VPPRNQSTALSVSWVTVDEVIYASTSPWPDASGNAAALHRIDLRRSGNDPLNWIAGAAAQSRRKILLTAPWSGDTVLIPSSFKATDVVVTNSPVSAGSRAAALTSETAVATQTFNDGQTDVWTDLRIQPVFASDDNASVTDLPAGASFAFYVGTNGQVVAYNGTNATPLVHTPLIWVSSTSEPRPTPSSASAGRAPCAHRWTAS